MMYFFR